MDADVDEDFHRFVLTRQRSLLRAAWLLTGDWATAEDLVQTALVRAWPHWARIGGSHGAAGREGADAYVRRIMVNKVLDWRKRHWRAETPTADLPDGPALAGPVAGTTRETHLVLVAALRTLPPRQRVVIVLRYFEDLTEADTAVAMDCTVGTVKTQASRALATLRAHPQLADLRLQGSV